MIRVVYTVMPSFPAADQHPEAVRYVVGPYVVDAIGETPTLAEVEALVNPPAIDLSDIDQLERTFRASLLVLRDYCNALKSEVRGLAVLLVQKGHITSQEAGALLAYDGTGAQDQKTVNDLRSDFSTKYNSLSGSPLG